MHSYHDVAKRGKMIAYVTSTGYMPPWPADPNYSHFIGEKFLLKMKKMILQKWYDQGSIPVTHLKYNNRVLCQCQKNTAILI